MSSTVGRFFALGLASLAFARIAAAQAVFMPAPVPPIARPLYRDARASPTFHYSPDYPSTHHGDPRVAGAIAGALFGGLAAAYYIGVKTADNCTTPEPCAHKSHVVVVSVTILGGMLAGGAIGSWIGGHIVDRQPRFTSQPAGHMDAMRIISIADPF